MSIGSSGSFFRSHSQESNSAGVSSAGVSCLLRTLSNGDTERGGGELLERGMGSLDGGRLHAMLRGLQGRFQEAGGDGEAENEEGEVDEDEEEEEEKTWRPREREAGGGGSLEGGRVQVTLRSFPGGVLEREERTWEEGGGREKGGRQRSRVTTILRGFSGGFGEAEAEREREREKEKERVREREREGGWEMEKLDEGAQIFKGLHGGFGHVLSLDVDELGDMERLGHMGDLGGLSSLGDLGDLGVMKVLGQGVSGGGELGLRGHRSDLGVVLQGVRGNVSEAVSHKRRGEVGVVGHSGVQVSMRASSNQNSVKSCSVRHGTKINMASAAMDMMELDWSDSD